MKYNNKKKLICFVKICLLLLTYLILTTFRYESNQLKLQKKVSQLQNLSECLESTILIDKLRKESINKIINIISNYNQAMHNDIKAEIAQEIYKMSIKYNNLNNELICATITHESAFTWDPKIISHANAMGLMQIIPTTGASVAQEEGLIFADIECLLFDPIINIQLGCCYLSKLITAYNVDGGLAAYNGGMKRAELWLKNGRAQGILYEETANYIPSILNIYEKFKQL